MEKVSMETSGEFKGVAGIEDVPVDPGMPDIGGFEGEIGFFAPLLLEGPDGGVLHVARLQ